MIYPKRPKDGYTCEPTYSKLLKMTKAELEKVLDFTIENQYVLVQLLPKHSFYGIRVDGLI